MSRSPARGAAALLAILLLVTSSSAAYATKYDYGPSPTTATARTPTVQLQTGSAGSSAVSSGVYGTVTLTASSIPLYYVPVTLTNCGTCAATPTPLQVLIQPNPSLYSTREASDLGNIRFCADSFCATTFYSWLEGCGTTSPYGACSTSSTNAAFWVRLTLPIGATGGTLKIYMVFLSTSTHFDGTTAGESPSMTGTYGQYDNGANVFTFYDNFAGTTLSAKWSQITSASGVTITVNNKLTVTTTTTAAYGFVISSSLFAPEVAEAYAYGGDSILGVSTTQNLNGFIAPHDGYSMDWYAGSDDLEYEGSSSHPLTPIAESTFPTGVWQVTWTGTGTGTQYFQDGAGKYNTFSYAGATIGNYAIYIGQSNGIAQTNIFYWARMRVYPPSGSMPTAGFGSLTPAANGVILTFTNSGSSSWLANLAVVTSSGTARLTNLSISFQSPYSKQIVLGSGVTNQNSGSQVTLAGGNTVSIIMGVAVSQTGTTTVAFALKIQNPPGVGTSVYCYDEVVLTVN